MLNSEILNDFLLILQIRQRWRLLPLLFSIVLKVVASAIRHTHKKIKGSKIENFFKNLPLFTDECIHRKLNFKASTKISKFSKNIV